MIDRMLGAPGPSKRSDRAGGLGHHRQMPSTAPLAIGGHRLTWPELPLALRHALEAAVGSPVVGAVSKEGGFSPALASVLTLADGTAVFAKAVNVSRNEFAVEALRREWVVLAGLPDDVPAPRLRWTFDDGDWVAMVIDAVDGRNPVQPWRSEELERFLEVATVLARRLSPSPIPAPVLAEGAASFTNWAALAAERVASERAADGRAVADRAVAEPASTECATAECATPGHGAFERWWRAHAEQLIALERLWSAAAAGTALLHGDLRSDNVLLTRHGFVVVDWPAVAIGAPWLDLVFSLPSVAMHGGGDPQELWRRHPLSRGVDPDAVNSALASIAGFFIARSREPAPPLLPTIREFQRAQGAAALAWLGRRLGWRPA